MIEQAYGKAIIPGFESLFKRRKTFAFWKQLEESQWWSRDRLEQWQLDRLGELIDHCYRQSPFYRELWSEYGLKLRSLQTLSDFCKWPITSRQSMRDHGESIRTKDSSLRVVSKSTGGSSGIPLQFVIDHEANDRRGAAAYRGYAWAGAAPGSKQSHLWGVNLGDVSSLRRWKEYLYSRYLYRRDVLNSFELSQDSIGEFVARINRFRPKALVAYTNPLYLFAQSIDRGGYEVHHPQSIIVGAEKLHDFQRKVIENTFGVPVFETYGSREFTLIGAECDRHAGLHLTMENLVVEVVDDDGFPTPPGQEGQVVVTDLFNIAMPFVRYAIGDRAVAGWKDCSCGRGLPLLQNVVGRQLDILTMPDGRQLPGEFFPHLMKDFDAVRQFQVVQRQRDVIELKLVVDDHWEQETKQSLQKKIQNAIGKSTCLRIDEVEQIPLTKAGKLQVVRGLAS